MKKELQALSIALLFSTVAFAQVVVEPESSGVLVEDSPVPAEFEGPSASEAELVLDTQGFTGLVTSVAFSPDDRQLAAASGKELRIWDVRTGDLITTLRGQRERNNHGLCNALAFSPDGKSLLVGIDDFSRQGSIREYDTRDFSIRRVLAGHNAPCRQLKFSQDGRYLASAGENGEILFWRWKDRRVAGRAAPTDTKQPLYYQFEFPTSDPVMLLRDFFGPILMSAPLGKRLTPNSAIAGEIQTWLGAMSGIQYPGSGEPDKMALRLDKGIWLAGGKSPSDGKRPYWVGAWKNGDAHPQSVFSRHRYVVSAVALSSDARLAASGDVLGDVFIWNPDTGKHLQEFRALGKPVYEVRMGTTLGHECQIAFGTKPHKGKDWARHSYATADTVFDFGRRATNPVRQPFGNNEMIEYSGHRLSNELRDGNYYIVSKKGDRLLNRYRLRAGAMPTSISFLHTNALELDLPVLVGDDGGALQVYDPRTDYSRRDFIGHEMFVTSASQSADGTLLVTASSDRTIRIWSLENYRRFGHLDCKILSGAVIEVKPGSKSERAGIRVGDIFVSMDGQDTTTLANSMLKGTYDFSPGQVVEAEFTRNGRPLKLNVTLHEESDLVEPLLNVFMTERGDWVVWTPQGYYDASPEGDRLIGWHVNQGFDRNAKYYPAQVFKKQLYRPDIIDLVLETRDVKEAIRQANAKRGIAESGIDFRDPREISKVAPPVVESVQILADDIDANGLVQLQAYLHSENALAISGATVLLNGRPVNSDSQLQGTDTKKELVQKIQLQPGENTLAVIGRNSASASEPTVLRKIEYKPSQPMLDIRPNLYVLAVGIGKYQQPDLTLQFPATDAQRFAEMMNRQKGGLYATVETKTLVDQEATRASILEGLEWLVRSTTQRDVAMIFVSAHGFRDTRDNFFLATHEIDPDRLRATGVASHDLMDTVKSLPGKVLVFADTCHSGGITGAKGVTDPLRELVSPDAGAIIFCSSTPRERSLEHASWGHGAFTKAFVDCLGDDASDFPPQDSHLTIAELDLNLTRRVKELTQGQQHPVTQKPSTVPDFNVFKLSL